jgi:hypothetical protein
MCNWLLMLAVLQFDGKTCYRFVAVSVIFISPLRLALGIERWVNFRLGSNQVVEFDNLKS